VPELVFLLGTGYWLLVFGGGEEEKSQTRQGLFDSGSGGEEEANSTRRGERSGPVRSPVVSGHVRSGPVPAFPAFFPVPDRRLSGGSGAIFFTFSAFSPIELPAPPSGHLPTGR
jgi:hypothetical protein